MGQNWNISIPNTSTSLTGGSGAVDGFSLTTAKSVFTQSIADSAFEAHSDMKLACLGMLGQAADTGVVIGTPCTIQATAGGAVQIYAGAGISAPVGAPGAPGGPVQPSKPATVNAGGKADALNRINDGVKAVGDIAGGVLDGAGALSGSRTERMLAAAKGLLGVTKGAADLSKAIDPTNNFGGSGGTATGPILSGSEGLLQVAEGLMQWPDDKAGAIANFAGALSKTSAFADLASNAMTAEGLAAATAQQQAKATAAAAAGHLSGPVDGPRIHEVAPANIDRECGADMTAKVAGNKTASVDGNIEYKSGGTISMKAFSKVETSSLNFEAYANIGATMKGLASAKVESLGQAVLEGKAKFAISTMALGKIDASSLKIKAKTTTFDSTANFTLTSPKITLGSAAMEVNSESTFQKQVMINDKLFVEKQATFKAHVVMEKHLVVKKYIKAQGVVSNNYFKAG